MFKVGECTGSRMILSSFALCVCETSPVRKMTLSIFAVGSVDLGEKETFSNVDVKAEKIERNSEERCQQ
jgi:hypothetical protein